MTKRDLGKQTFQAKCDIHHFFVLFNFFSWLLWKAEFTSECSFAKQKLLYVWITKSNCMHPKRMNSYPKIYMKEYLGGVYHRISRIFHLLHRIRRMMKGEWMDGYFYCTRQPTSSQRFASKLGEKNYFYFWCSGSRCILGV